MGDACLSGEMTPVKPFVCAGKAGLQKNEPLFRRQLAELVVIEIE